MEYGWVLVGIAYANILEWIIHRYILHGLGKKKKNVLSFHWHGHHKQVRKSSGFDLDYKTLSMTGEVKGLLLLICVHTLSLYISTTLFITLVSYSIVYYIVHGYSHLNPSWSKRWVPWHYDHHMGKNQDANWCVLFPMADYMFGSRVKYPHLYHTLKRY